MKYLLYFLIVSSSLFSQVEYSKLLQQFPETLGRNGSWKQGEIEIATAPEEIKRIQKQCIQRYIRMGYTKEEAENYSKVGIVSEDHYWIWVRDAVTFPGGIPGVYDRIIWKSGISGSHGVAILPLLPNKKVLVNVNFRHATRSWEIELPRGARKEKEAIEKAARRELKEETGCIASKLIFLGEIAPDSGVLAGTVPVYIAQIQEKKQRHQDESEAIALNLEISLEEIQNAFEKGYLVITVGDMKMKAYCRDPFLSYALMQGMWKGLIEPLK